MTPKDPNGYSMIVDSPEMKKYQEKQRRWRNIWLVLVVVAPIVGFCAYAMFTGDMEMGEALKYGPCVSLIMFLFGIYPTVKQKMQSSYIGTIIEMKHKTKVHYDNNDHEKIVTTYYIVTRDLRGKKHKHKSTDYEGIYSYLKVGDEVRYLPQFPNPFEKKLVPGDTHACCSFCQHMVSLDYDTCPHCKAPILK